MTTLQRINMGVYLKIKREVYRPDIGKYTKILHAKATKAWNEAISAYIQAAASIVSQHQETGMSYASLFPAARQVRAMGKIPPLSPEKDFTVFSAGTSGHAGEYKNARAGEHAGEKSATINYGSPFRPVFTFDFEIAVYQYLMHEMGAFNPHIAWESMEAGRQAMNDYLNLFGSEIFPRFDEYFTKLSTEVR